MPKGEGGDTRGGSGAARLGAAGRPEAAAHAATQSAPTDSAGPMVNQERVGAGSASRDLREHFQGAQRNPIVLHNAGH